MEHTRRGAIVIRLLAPYSAIPTWLNRVTFSEARDGQVAFVATWSIVYRRRGKYIVRPLHPMFDYVFYINGAGAGVTIEGQNGGVIVDARPIISWPLITLALACFIAAEQL